MSKEEHFLFCEALSGKPTRKDEIGKVSTAAGILIHYHPNSGWSKLKCPFLDYDSREHDQLMQFVIPWFFFGGGGFKRKEKKRKPLQGGKKLVAKTPENLWFG